MKLKSTGKQEDVLKLAHSQLMKELHFIQLEQSASLSSDFATPIEGDHDGIEHFLHEIRSYG